MVRVITVTISNLAVLLREKYLKESIGTPRSNVLVLHIMHTSEVLCLHLQYIFVPKYLFKTSLIQRFLCRLLVLPVCFLPAPQLSPIMSLKRIKLRMCHKREKSVLGLLCYFGQCILRAYRFCSVSVFHHL